MEDTLKTVKALLISARPQQWLKNLSLFAAAFFWGDLLKPEVFFKLTEAFVIFSLLSSASYLINDINDREKDKKHPVKKRRPIASGEVSVRTASWTAALLALGALTFSYLYFNPYFFAVSAIFMLLQLSYSFAIRDVIILDALWVATAFVLRVYAGAFALPTPISAWLILSVIGLALLLAFGKRRSERTLLSKLHQKLQTRETLRHYPDRLLDAAISTSSAYAALSYSLFAFQTSPRESDALSGFLPATLSSPKWFLITVPIVIYGIVRYLFVIYEKREGESPEKVLLTDYPLLTAVVVWLVVNFTIIYGFKAF